MKYWEFLIQKEGDQTWLPLETEQVEILEGRYRVVAHTDRADTPMNIRVSQLITDEVPPRKRVRKRAGQTNEAGLVVVMPFVHLKPGQWELQCSSADDGESWRYNVQLQVFAHTEEDWSGEWPVPEDADAMGKEPVGDDGSDDADGLVNQDLPLIQAQAALEAQLQNRGLSASGLANAIAPEEYSYGVALRQQAYLAHHNQPMTIMGHVDSLSDAVHEQTSQLWIRLQNPETAQVIMEAHRPLSLSRLPADFKVQIQLPTEVTTRVILGEVSLRTAALDPEEKVEILASTAFTITAGIAQLLDTIANQDPGTFEEDLSVPSGAAAEPELAVTSLTPAQTSFVPAIGVVLPPQLDRSDFGTQIAENPLAQGEPALPSFGSFYNDVAYDNSAANLIVSDAPEAEPAAESDDYAAAAAPLPAEDENFDPSESLYEIADDGLQGMGEQLLPVDFAVASDEPDFVEAADDAIAQDDDAIAQDNTDTATTYPHADSVSDTAAEPVSDSVSESIEYPTVFNPPDNDPVMPVSVERPPMVAQPAQFLGTSIEDGDLEADEIAAVLEDIDQNLRSEESDLDALEAPGIEGSLPSYSVAPVEKEDGEPEKDFVPTARDPYPKERTSERSDESAQTPAARSAGGARSVNRRQSARQVEANVDFQALKLKDHFWNRLSTLTHESHKQATQIAQGMEEAGVSRGGFSAFSDAPELAQDEVVIYDDPTLEQPSKSALGGQLIEQRQPMGWSDTTRDMAGESVVSSAFEQQNQPANYGRPAPVSVGADVRSGVRLDSRSSNVQTSQQQFRQQPIVPEDLPEMALPVISVPMGDLVAGAKIAVTVRTRPATYKPFIKLWMVDRQSRSLVIEPQLLTNLMPNVVGDLEATTEMLVPMDCLDVQIAAIAVDMATQQESNKAIVNRHVVPANQASAQSNFRF